MNAHWATQYIGVPWVFGGKTIAEGFDCWGLFCDIQRNHFGRNVPDIDIGHYTTDGVAHEFANNSERKNWRQVQAPKEGDAVLMRSARYPNHVGVWITDGENAGVLHTMEKSGAMFSSQQSLRNSGWRVVGYYRHK